MGSSEGIPVEFVIAAAGRAAPGSVPAQFAAEKAKTLAPGPARERLLSALLSAAFRDAAPQWLVEAAASQGLSEKHEHWAGSAIELAAAALEHPDCTGETRAAALWECTEVQLAHLGTRERAAVLIAAVCAELRRRSPHPEPMTRALLAQPSPARRILRNGRLADAVFDTAYDLLPTEPDRHARAELGPSAKREWLSDQYAAWESMWTSVLEHQPERHAQCVERSESCPANRLIRQILLAVMPWTVEPSLLQDLAAADLAGFHTAAVVTEVCRALHDGASRDEVRERFADSIAALSSYGLKHLALYLDGDLLEPEWGCNEAANWAMHAVKENWRLLLNPAEAKPRYGGEPYPWQISATRLRELGRAFADTTLPALLSWEPKLEGAVDYPGLLRWIAALLAHLPQITDEVRATTAAVIGDARTALRPTGYRAQPHRDCKEAEELIARIGAVLADRAPNAAPRQRPLGDPASITVHELEGVQPATLAAYLDRHAGDDALVEKALLAIASTGYGQCTHFGDVLGRHSEPGRAVREITHDLRSRLGGAPAAREQWARAVLALPDCDRELIRELPAWTALKLSEDRSDARRQIVGVVTAALGDDAQAWRRLAEGPASYAGPTAWLRLGEVLDAASSGAPWPTSPRR